MHQSRGVEVGDQKAMVKTGDGATVFCGVEIKKVSGKFYVGDLGFETLGAAMDCIVGV